MVTNTAQKQLREERNRAKASLIENYIKYVKANHEDPSSSVFKEYLENNNCDVTAWDSNSEHGKLFDSLTDLREAAIKEDETLKDLTFSEKDIDAEEMKARIEDAVKHHTRFVVSSIVAGKAADVDAFLAVKDYCKRNNAALILLPVADVKNSRCLFEWNWDPVFKDEMILFGSYDVQLNENIMLNSIRVTAKQMNPLTSLDALIGKTQCSMVVGSVKNRLRAIPAMKGERVPLLMTTAGALTKNDYKNDYLMSQRTSKIASYYHTIGARVIELDKSTGNPFTRELVIKDGVLIDMGVEYQANQRPKQSEDIVAVLGDSHAGSYDDNLLESIFTCIDEVGNISEIVLHDLCDSKSISHHTEDDFITRIELAKTGKNNLINEIDEVVSYLNLVTGAPNIDKVSVVPSNHDDHIYRWLKEGRAYKNKDFLNIPSLCKLQLAVSEGGVKNVLQYLVENLATIKLKHPDKVQWLCEDKSYRKHGIELSIHGNRGANGAKGSLKTFQKAVPSAVVGHAHSIEILDEIYQVGTTSELDMEYNKGLSTWTRTCCLCYKNGTKQMVTFLPNGDGGYDYRA